jgi:hypothetical protein
MGAHAEGDLHDLLAERHLEIQRQPPLRLLHEDILILHMTAILAQVEGQAISAARLGGVEGGRKVRFRVGMDPPESMSPVTRLTECGHMVEIDAEFHGRSGRSWKLEDRSLKLERGSGDRKLSVAKNEFNLMT